MRSGPSARTISCSTRRQRKRSGGPSGTSARVSIGCGGAKKRSGRRGGPSRGGAVYGGDEPGRAVGIVRVPGREAQHAVAPEAGGEPIDETADVVRLRRA